MGIEASVFTCLVTAWFCFALYLPMVIPLPHKAQALRSTSFHVISQKTYNKFQPQRTVSNRRQGSTTQYMHLQMF